MTMLHLQLLSFLQNQDYKNVTGHFIAELLFCLKIEVWDQ